MAVPLDPNELDPARLTWYERRVASAAVAAAREIEREHEVLGRTRNGTILLHVFKEGGRIAKGFERDLGELGEQVVTSTPRPVYT